MAILDITIPEVFIKDDEATGLPLYRRMTDILIHAKQKNVEVKYEEYLISNGVEINKKEVSYTIVDKQEVIEKSPLKDAEGNDVFEEIIQTINTGELDENGNPVTVQFTSMARVYEDVIVQAYTDRFSYWYEQLGQPVLIPQVNQTLLTL